MKTVIAIGMAVFVLLFLFLVVWVLGENSRFERKCETLCPIKKDIAAPAIPTAAQFQSVLVSQGVMPDRALEISAMLGDDEEPQQVKMRTELAVEPDRVLLLKNFEGALNRCESERLDLIRQTYGRSPDRHLLLETEAFAGDLQQPDGNLANANTLILDIESRAPTLEKSLEYFPGGPKGGLIRSKRSDGSTIFVARRGKRLKITETREESKTIWEEISCGEGATRRIFSELTFETDDAGHENGEDFSTSRHIPGAGIEKISADKRYRVYDYTALTEPAERLDIVILHESMDDEIDDLLSVNKLFLEESLKVLGYHNADSIVRIERATDYFSVDSARIREALGKMGYCFVQDASLRHNPRREHKSKIDPRKNELCQNYSRQEMTALTRKLGDSESNLQKLWIFISPVALIEGDVPCGVATGDVRALKLPRIGWVNHACTAAESSSTLAHEVAHLLGVDHELGAAQPPKDDAYARVAEIGEERIGTLTASGSLVDTRLPFLSSELISIDGVSFGSPHGGNAFGQTRRLLSLVSEGEEAGSPDNGEEEDGDGEETGTEIPASPMPADPARVVRVPIVRDHCPVRSKLTTVCPSGADYSFRLDGGQVVPSTHADIHDATRDLFLKGAKSIAIHATYDDGGDPDDRALAYARVTSLIQYITHIARYDGEVMPAISVCDLSSRLEHCDHEAANVGIYFLE